MTAMFLKCEKWGKVLKVEDKIDMCTEDSEDILPKQSKFWYFIETYFSGAVRHDHCIMRGPVHAKCFYCSHVGEVR